MGARGWWVAAVVAALGLSACSGAPSGSPKSSLAGGSAKQAAPGAAAPAVAVRVSPSNGSKNVRPDTPVVVTVQGGSIAAAELVTSEGQRLEGAVEGSSWRATDALKPATTYSVKVTTKGESGATSTTRSSFTTLTPRSYTRVTLVPGDDWTVGVGMPVIVRFAAPVTRRAAAEKALRVSSTPSVEGAWRWMSATEVHWRPKEYWPSGTTVRVNAAMGGVELSKGSWGRRTVTSRFTVGAQQISTVDVAKHTMTVRRNGKVIKVIPVTTGLTNSKPTFPTRAGIKVIMSREASVTMDAASTGTDPRDPHYYNLKVKWALRLTYSGEFLHAAPWSVAQQGRANVSHGCTGMSNANAKWLYDNSQIGDVVVYKNSKRPLEWGNGYTAWNKSFSEWTADA